MFLGQEKRIEKQTKVILLLGRAESQIRILTKNVFDQRRRPICSGPMLAESKLAAVLQHVEIFGANSEEKLWRVLLLPGLRCSEVGTLDPQAHPGF